MYDFQVSQARKEARELHSFFTFWSSYRINGDGTLK
jgi:hypothetical protein